MSDDNKKDDEKKGDLTSLFDLSDFEHEEDPETEAYFQNQNDSDDEFSDNQNEEPDQHEYTQTDFNPQEALASEYESDQDSEQELEQTIEEDESFDFDSDSDLDDDTDDFFADEPTLESSEELNDDFDSAFNESFEEDDSNQEEVEEPLTSPSENEAEVKDELPVASYEKFEDVQKFAQNSHYGPISAKGDPPFSLIIENIQYQEDATKIMSILKEYGFISQDNEHIISKGLDRGSAIISRVSEFAVIFLYQKLSHFPITLKAGPSDLIFPSSVSDIESKGAVSSSHLRQNKEESKYISEHETSLLFSSQSQIPGYKIEDFLGLCHESLEFQAYPEAGELSQDIETLETREVFELKKQEVMEQLRNKVIEKKGNAGVDFKLQTQALFTEDQEDYKYLISVECNAVWIKKV